MPFSQRLDIITCFLSLNNKFYSQGNADEHDFVYLTTVVTYVLYLLLYLNYSSIKMLIIGRAYLCLNVLK